MKKSELKQIIKEIILEGYSNYNNLTQLVRDKIEQKWDRIVKRLGNTQFFIKFDVDGQQKSVTVKFDAKSLKGSYETENYSGSDYLIVISTLYIDDLEESKDNIIATLVHELTHISQHLNNFHSYTFKIQRNEFKKQKEINPRLKYQNYYDAHHHEYGTEREAVLIQLFEYLRRKNIRQAMYFTIQSNDYLNFYPFSKIIKKAILYGVDKNTFDSFLKELENKLTSDLNVKSLTWPDNAKYDMIKYAYKVAKQFEIPIKEKIKKSFETFDYNESESYLNYNVVEKEITNIINDKNLK